MTERAPKAQTLQEKLDIKYKSLKEQITGLSFLLFSWGIGIGELGEQSDDIEREMEESGDVARAITKSESMLNSMKKTALAAPRAIKVKESDLSEGRLKKIYDKEIAEIRHRRGADFNPLFKPKE